MSKILALLSGKGGSGKTTLALSMSSMLSDCGVKVLLIDCDLCTNGATYFYENRLSDNCGIIKSFHNMINGLDNENYSFISINENMDFIPSVIRISKNNTESYSYRKEDDKNILNFIRKYEGNYDVIIFDCQAGYTDVLRLVLPIINISLVVMEADAISSAAIRGLYLKIGEFLEDKKVYQIFNKATDEEYEIYSKISGGTVFTNIETVKFDWKIRKAFCLTEIPDMNKTSSDYGVRIYNICKILLKEEYIQNMLNKYEIVIKLNENLELENKLERKIALLQKENAIVTKSNTHRKYLAMFIEVMVITTCFCFYSMVNSKVLSNDEIVSYVVILLMIVITLVNYFTIRSKPIVRGRKERYFELNMYRKQLRQVIEKIQELQEQYNAYKND